MQSRSLFNLPREIIYLIFRYLRKEDVAYAFFQLNDTFASAVTYFIHEKLQLVDIDHEKNFQFSLSTLLPSIGTNLRCLSIGSPHSLMIYLKTIQDFCPNLNTLHIYCHTPVEDIRLYAIHLIHPQLDSLKLMYEKKPIGEELCLNLLNKSSDEEHQATFLTSSLVLHLSSMNDFHLLKRFSQSTYLTDGLYRIECLATGEWLTDSKDDLCTMSKKLHRDSLFSVKHVDTDQCSREYQISREGNQQRCTVLIPYEEERWISSSILSIHRKESSQSCSRFTFERISDKDEFYIRPCYSHAKRLQLLGKRVIVSLCDNENTANYRFKLHRLS